LLRRLVVYDHDDKTLEFKREQKQKKKIVLFEMIGSGREKLIRIRTGNTSGQIEFVI
jgi:hypothetical protein